MPSYGLGVSCGLPLDGEGTFGDRSGEAAWSGAGHRLCFPLEAAESEKLQNLWCLLQPVCSAQAGVPRWTKLCPRATQSSLRYRSHAFTRLVCSIPFPPAKRRFNFSLRASSACPGAAQRGAAAPRGCSGSPRWFWGGSAVWPCLWLAAGLCFPHQLRREALARCQRQRNRK